MNEQKSFITRFGELIDQYRADQRRNPSQEARTQPSRLRRFLRWLTPNGGTLLLIAVLLLTQNVWARTAQSPANIPGPSATTVNYQGRLADSGGTPLDGTYGMSFSLWDTSTGGSLIWPTAGPEDHPAVPVSEGLFSVGLGSKTSGGIPTTVWDGDRYLEITVGGETLSPRELIRSVPIAGMALTVPDGAIGASQISDTFGASAMPLSNVIIQPWGTEIWSGVMEAGKATLDLTNQSSLTASALILHVYVRDSNQGARVRFFYPGETNGSKMQTVFAQSSGMNSMLIIVPCDSGQQIGYKATAELDLVVIRLLGWIEPAKQ